MWYSSIQRSQPFLNQFSSLTPLLPSLPCTVDECPCVFFCVYFCVSVCESLCVCLCMIKIHPTVQRSRHCTMQFPSLTHPTDHCHAHWMSVHMFLFVFLSVCVCVCLCVCVCVCVCLSICVCVCMCVCVCVCVRNCMLSLCVLPCA